MTKPMFIAWHLGLGDALICNGLVRAIADGRQIVVPAKIPNVASVRFMFSDLPNVRVEAIPNEQAVRSASQGCEFLGLGLWSNRKSVPAIGWDRQFYEDAQVPFECRWERFHTPPSPVLSAPLQPFAFVHDQPEQGRRITRDLPKIPVYEPLRPPHIFYHVTALFNALEIHVVNSCFLNLAESVPTPNAQRLVLHNYARTDCGPPTLRKAWEILN